MSFTRRGRCLGGVPGCGDGLVSLHCPDLFRAALATVFGGSKILFPMCKGYSPNVHFSYHTPGCKLSLLHPITFLLQHNSPELTSKNIYTRVTSFKKKISVQLPSLKNHVLPNSLQGHESTYFTS